MADFNTETTSLEGEEQGTHQGHLGEAKPEIPEGQKEPLWNLYTNGASNGDRSGAELILISLESIELTYTMRLEFSSTNNEAEYEALLAGLRMAKKIKVQYIRAHVDSLLVANQFKGSEVVHLSRVLNKKADALSKLAFVAFDHLEKDVKVETIKKPSIFEDIFASMERPQPNWMTPICRYLQDGIVPEDKQEARRLRIRALQYEIIEGNLYRRSYLGISLKFIDYKEAKYVIREIHEGICGMHMGAKMVASRAMRA
ncbi:uncharacterized protein LOC143623982 [Bidens hawaiensis]|uniref:uncharacterized protein LOC143623982 n=1 Tax=Bidens hawaiensis TaxID=980011 RepID=UPI00404966F8